MGESESNGRMYNASRAYLKAKGASAVRTSPAFYKYH